MKPVGDIDFPKMEEAILQSWHEKEIFRAQDEQRKDAREFSFYDGPPFANGLPHYGHLLANTIKDTVPRYWIMKGYKINRRFGWDCHGLPVEFEIEKREQLKGRPDILKMGVAKFNDICKESVLHYTNEWRRTITRLGRWVDWNDQYRTMDRDYMESVWWVFGELYRKGLVYKGFKVVPYSPRTTSVVSNFEANQNYKDVSDPSVFIKFKMKGRDEFLVGWTTTPWTLPSNLALAVNEKVNYVRLLEKATGDVLILGEGTQRNLYKYPENEPPFEILETISGQSLLGLSYEPLFAYFKDQPNAFRVLHGDYVDTQEGTGIVHQAPAFGEDDFFNCKSNGIDLVDPINETGHFTNATPDLENLYFKDADKTVCKILKDKGLLLRQTTLVHSYPFDERTDTPLMYKAVPSWYVAVEKFSDRLQANNETINWVPSHIRSGRMGSWLANARDWAISRNRFWGTPLPVWVCRNQADHVQVFSSIAELEKKAGRSLEDIHLQHISKLTLKCEECAGTMHSENLVFDCWFESGSMPYAQLHYPFQAKERFASVFPADFVAEGIDQTRGWFYVLNVLSTALFDKPAFKNVIVNGVILDSSGKKMSKRHRNYTAPDMLFEKYGADSVRLYMLNSQLLRAEDLSFTDDGVKDVTRKVLLPLWNACSFLTTYAHADGWGPGADLESGNIPKVTNEMDRWILSRLESLLTSVEEHMAAYKLYLVVPEVVEFIDDLTNWYIRLSRRRFWGTDVHGAKNDQEQAFSTLYFVLLEFSKIFAPFAPFLSDRVFQVLTEGFEKEKISVHLCTLPHYKAELRDEKLEERMELLRRVVTQGRSLRQQHKVKIRQVLPTLTVITKDKADKKVIEDGTELLKGELNVKRIVFTTEESEHVRLSLRPNLRSLGVRFGARLKDFAKTIAELNKSPEKIEEMVSILESGKSLSMLGDALSEGDFLIDRQAKDERLIATEKGVTILLDTHLTDELIAEGFARELVNRIQNLRKSSGLSVSDRIDLQIVAPKKMAEAVKYHRQYILEETLGKQLEIFSDGGDCSLKFVESYQIDNIPCIIALEVVKS
ncbi:MAG: isoleucine--tRNA ligase [Deltaproteobacteria bacterium]|nr:isoleucine--tRNA ligase [Deltaproteobacteria bacterium]